MVHEAPSFRLMAEVLSTDMDDGVEFICEYVNLAAAIGYGSIWLRDASDYDVHCTDGDRTVKAVIGSVFNGLLASETVALDAAHQAKNHNKIADTVGKFEKGGVPINC